MKKTCFDILKPTLKRRKSVGPWTQWLLKIADNASESARDFLGMGRGDVRSKLVRRFWEGFLCRFPVNAALGVGIYGEGRYCMWGEEGA